MIVVVAALAGAALVLAAYACYVTRCAGMAFDELNAELDDVTSRYLEVSSAVSRLVAVQQRVEHTAVAARLLATAGQVIQPDAYVAPEPEPVDEGEPADWWTAGACLAETHGSTVVTIATSERRQHDVTITTEDGVRMERIFKDDTVVYEVPGAHKQVHVTVDGVGRWVEVD